MKKIFLIISAAITAISFSACNGDSEKTETKAQPDTAKTQQIAQRKILIDANCSGTGNALISRKEADSMQSNYAAIYINASASGRNLFKSVWVDASVIIAFTELFKKYPTKFDGVRFINAARNANDGCKLILVPTIRRNPLVADKSNHVNDWTKVELPDGVTPEFQGFNLGDNVTNSRRDTFYNTYTTGFSNIKCLSSGVWFDKCVFNVFRDLIDQYGVDGMNVFVGAYLDLRYQEQNPSQIAKNQSSFILVPTTPDGGGHKDDWELLRNNSNYNKDFGYNHGELCPNKCN